jgi:hypothetical protein
VTALLAGRLPRTVCRNGGRSRLQWGPVPTPPTFPHFLGRPDAVAGPLASILQQACGEQVVALRLPLTAQGEIGALGCDAVLASHPKPRARNPQRSRQLRSRPQWASLTTCRSIDWSV